VGKYWPPRAVPTAIILVLGALAFLLAWWLGDIDHLDAWTPNIVVGAVVLAATITFVQWIIEREASERSKPRRKRALDVIGKAFWEFAFHAYTDILFTTVKTAPTDLNIPSDPVALFEFWMKWQDKKDAPRPRLGDGRSLFLSEGLEFVSRVQRVVDADRDLLPSELVVAVDNLSPIFSGDSLFDMAEKVSKEGRQGLDDWLLSALIPAAGQVGQALRVVSSERLRPVFLAPDAAPEPTDPS
jgi:hypothetical protein